MNRLKKYVSPMLMLSCCIVTFIHAPFFDSAPVEPSHQAELEMETAQERAARVEKRRQGYIDELRKEQQNQEYQDTLVRIDQTHKQNLVQAQKDVDAGLVQQESKGIQLRDLKDRWEKTKKTVKDNFTSWSNQFQSWRTTRKAKTIYEKKAKNPSYTQDDEKLTEYLETLDSTKKQKALNAWMKARAKIYDQKIAESKLDPTRKATLIKQEQEKFQTEINAIEKEFMKKSLKSHEVLITSGSTSGNPSFEILNMKNINPKADLTTQWKALKSQDIDIPEKFFSDIVAKYYIKQAKITLSANSDALLIVNNPLLPFFDFDVSFKGAIKDELEKQINNLREHLNLVTQKPITTPEENEEFKNMLQEFQTKQDVLKAQEKATAQKALNEKQKADFDQELTSRLATQKTNVDEQISQAQAAQFKAEREKLINLEAKQRTATNAAEETEFENKIQNIEKDIAEQHAKELQELHAKQLQDLVDHETNQRATLTDNQQSDVTTLMQAFEKQATKLNVDRQVRAQLETELATQHAQIVAQEAELKDALAKNMKQDATEIVHRLTRQRLDKEEEEKRLQTIQDEIDTLQKSISQAQKELQATQLKQISELEMKERSATTQGEKTEFENMIHALKEQQAALEKKATLQAEQDATMQDAGDMFKKADEDAAQRESEIKAAAQKQEAAAKKAKLILLQQLPKNILEDVSFDFGVINHKKYTPEDLFDAVNKNTLTDKDFDILSQLITIHKAPSISSIPTGFLNSLEPSIIQVLPVEELSIEQLKALSPDLTERFDTEQIQALTPEQWKFIESKTTQAQKTDRFP